MTGQDTKYASLKKNVYLTGFTSLLNDVSAEMIYPVVPLLMTCLIGAAAPAFIGIIEGIAVSSAAFSKVLFGWLADQSGRYKSMTIGGYILAHISKLLLIIAGTWWFVLIVRFMDRIGKGLRSAPRDTLISESVPVEKRGWGFSFQRAMDHTGAIIGSLFAFFLIKYLLPDKFPEPVQMYRHLFKIALVPAVISVVFLFFITVPSQLRNFSAAIKKETVDKKKLPHSLKMFLVATALFALGNSSNMFLLMRSAEFDFGLGISATLLLYAGYNTIASVFSTFFGKLSDRIGYRKVILIGYGLYVVVYLGFGVVRAPMLIVGAWLMYGLYTAMTEGVEKAYVSSHSDVENRGYALGLFSTIVGAGVLPANLIAGILYTKVGPAYPFILGSTMALVAWIIIFIEEK
jgi:MFS family permease